MIVVGPHASPDGTRARTAGCCSGFRLVALQAGVPVALACIDRLRREVRIDSAWRPGDDLDADMACFERRPVGRTGKRPALATPVRPR